MPTLLRPDSAGPADVAVVDLDRALTWDQVDEIVNRCANRLLGLRLGEGRVAVVAENTAETALAHLGALLAGTSSVPVNAHLTAGEIAYILGDSGTRLVFAGPGTADRAVEAAAQVGVESVVAWGPKPPGAALAWNEWLAGGDPSDPPEHVAPRPNLLYTSGTTGRPKGTELPPTMFAGGATMGEHLAGLAGNRLAAFGTHLVVGPMYHTGPLTGMRLLAAGVPLVIPGRFDPEATLAAIAAHRCGSTIMVPTHFIRLLALPEEVRRRYDTSSLSAVIHTGGPCPVEVKRAMIEWWGPIISESYGATEVGAVCSIDAEEWLTRPGSVGRAVAPFEAMVVDDAGAEVAAGTEGRLYFRDLTGRGIVYPTDPEKTAAAHLAPGVFTLGEVGYVDGDGYVFLTGRASDLVVSGGVNIYPAESEQVLVTHSGVADAACIGVPDPEMGEALLGLVVPAAGAGAPPDPAELIAHCRARLAGYKCPRSIVFVSDLGRSAMGKIDKRALRAPYWPEKEGSVQMRAPR